MQSMNRYLFIFGFESPREWAQNARHGTDDESSSAVWILASSSEAALALGCEYAERFVDELFSKATVANFPGWKNGDFAFWIEQRPFERFSEAALKDLPEIRET